MLRSNSFYTSTQFGLRTQIDEVFDLLLIFHFLYLKFWLLFIDTKSRVSINQPKTVFSIICLDLHKALSTHQKLTLDEGKQYSILRHLYGEFCQSMLHH